MAELQTSSYASKAKASPVLDRKAVQLETRNPFEGAGGEKIGEAKIWEASQGFTSQVLVKASKMITDQADQELADEFVDRTNTDLLKTIEYIDNELPKRKGSEIRPEEVLKDFENGQIEGFNLKDITEYEGYEQLQPKFRKQVKDHYRKAKGQATELIMRQMSKLSNEHTMMSLNKQALDIQGQVQDILNDKKNIIVAVEPKDYVKNFEGQGGEGPGRAYDSYMRYQLSKGRLGNLGGLLKTEAKPEDLGQEGGLTDDAKRKIDQILNRFSDRVFDAKARNVISMKDVESIHTALMSGVLEQHFRSQFHADPHTAISKAEKSEYRYKNEFTGYSGEKELVDYILNPDFTYPYIEKYHVKMSKPPTADPYAIQDMMEKLYDMDAKGTPLTTDQVKNMAFNDARFRGDPNAITKLMGIALKLNTAEAKQNQVSDHVDIVKSIETDIINNPHNIEKYFTEQNNGDWKLKSLEELEKVIPDSVKKERRREWKYGDTGYEWITGEKEIVTKGQNRIGKTLLKDTDFTEIVRKYNASQKKIEQANYLGTQLRRVDTPLGARAFMEEWTDFDTYPGQLSREKITEIYHDPDSVQGAMLRMTYSTEAEATVALGKVLDKAKKISGKKSNLSFVEGTDQNEKALLNALKEQHTIDIATMRNVSANLNPANIKEASPGYNPLQILENKMIEETGRGFNEDQEEKIKFYHTAQKKLMNIQNDLIILEFNEIDAYLAELKGRHKNRGHSIKYFLNYELANVVESQLALRKAILSNPTTARSAIIDEMDQGDYWKNQFPLVNMPEGAAKAVRRAVLIAQKLQIPVDIMDAVIETRGVTDSTRTLADHRKDLSILEQEVSKNKDRLNQRMSMNLNTNR
tara:strand:+ start:6024 stop:8615 length:2592 start_codon:yes stop_codon:yes gene_type:complete